MTFTNLNHELGQSIELLWQYANFLRVATQTQEPPVEGHVVLESLHDIQTTVDRAIRQYHAE